MPYGDSRNAGFSGPQRYLKASWVGPLHNGNTTDSLGIAPQEERHIEPLALGLIPLDDRPCNRIFPAQLAEAAGHRLEMPPGELLGWFTDPGNCEEVGRWLCACPAQRLIVSIDMLCYGGLIASRAPAVRLEVALDRLETLRRLRSERPEATIFAFSVLPRLGTTVAAAHELQRHADLVSYSQLVDRVERLGEDSARGDLEDLLARLDPEALASYVAVRRRNHAISKAAIRLVADEVVDYLVLAQEDAAAVGLHVPEQLALRAQCEEFRVTERVAIQSGADEVAMVLIARHAIGAAGRSPEVAVEYGTDAGAEIIPKYEDRPLRDTVECQLRAAGARLAVPGQADAMLFVHTPLVTQREAAEAPPLGQAPGLALQAERVVDGLRAASEVGLPVGLVDAAYCNGADGELIDALRRSGGARHLSAFAAWNTTANSVGTAVSQLCLTALARSQQSACDDAFRRFTGCRLVDDYGYQSVVRPSAMELARSQEADPFALGDDWPEFERQVSSELEPLAHSLYSELLAAPDDPPAELRVSLPWRRLFEVEIELLSSLETKNRQ